MKLNQTTSLKAKHDAYIARCREAGDKLVAYRVPCCGGLLETRAAPKRETWDTMSQCPHCEKVYMKITKGDKVTTYIPEGME